MVEVNEERVREIFNKIAPDYDKMNSIISFRQHDRWRAKTMKQIQLSSEMKVLDLCCGTGDWTLDLAASGASVTGLDFSEKMLAVARERTKNQSNIQLMQGDAMSLPFENDSFDVLTIGYGLRNTPDYNQVLSEIYRVLKAGGLAVSIDTSHPTNPFYGQIFNFYFRTIMPALGKIFSQNYQEYRWLQKSARDFPDAKTLATLFQSAGFTKVDYHYLSGGVAASHFAWKKL